MSQTRIAIAVFLSVLLYAGAVNAGIGVGARYSYVRNTGIEDNSTMIGAMVRLKSTFIGLEGAIDTRSEELNDGSDLKSRPVTASLMVFPVPVAYGLAGLGLYHSTVESAGAEDTDTKLGFHYGVGVEMPLLPLLKLTGDYRRQYIDYEFDDIPSAVGKVDADAWAVSAGVIVYLK